MGEGRETEERFMWEKAEADYPQLTNSTDLKGKERKEPPKLRIVSKETGTAKTHKLQVLPLHTFPSAAQSYRQSSTKSAVEPKKSDYLHPTPYTTPSAPALQMKSSTNAKVLTFQSTTTPYSLALRLVPQRPSRYPPLIPQSMTFQPMTTPYSSHSPVPRMLY